MASNLPAGPWPSAAIPIDPALQPRPGTQPGTPQPGYQQPFQYYQPANYAMYQQQQPQQQQYQPPSAQQPSTHRAPERGGGMDTADVNTLNDPLASAGVDLRAEEESLQRSYDTGSYRPSYNEDRTHKQPSNLTIDTRHLGASMRVIAAHHKVAIIPEDSVTYLALALRARLQDLLTAMIEAARHRTSTQFDRRASFYEGGDPAKPTPMWKIVIRSDVSKQLAAIEKVEREEETRVRKERAERAEAAAVHAAALQAQQEGMMIDEEEGAGAKKKRKKDAGPGVTARNMSDDVRKKMSNAVASQAAGLGGKYAWMNASAGSSAPKPKPAAPSGSSAASPAAASGSGTAASSWARPYLPTKQAAAAPVAVVDDKSMKVTLKDAMFVVEKERGHGGGRGAALGWV